MKNAVIVIKYIGTTIARLLKDGILLWKGFLLFLYNELKYIQSIIKRDTKKSPTLIPLNKVETFGLSQFFSLFPYLFILSFNKICFKSKTINIKVDLAFDKIETHRTDFIQNISRLIRHQNFKSASISLTHVLQFQSCVLLLFIMIQSICVLIQSLFDRNKTLYTFYLYESVVFTFVLQNILWNEKQKKLPKIIMSFNCFTTLIWYIRFTHLVWFQRELTSFGVFTH